jgi:hypothetical protein
MKKTKYFCKGKFKQSDGGYGWVDEGMRQNSVLTGIMVALREHSNMNFWKRISNIHIWSREEEDMVEKMM